MIKKEITKKMLVEYSFKKGMSKGRIEGAGKKFILPVHEDGKSFFVTIPDLKPVVYGFVVYTGKDQTTESLLMQINLTRKKITPSFDWYEKIFVQYLEKISELKITDVVKLSFDEHGKICFENQDIPSGPSKSNIFK